MKKYVPKTPQEIENEKYDLLLDICDAASDEYIQDPDFQKKIQRKIKTEPFLRYVNPDDIKNARIIENSDSLGNIFSAFSLKLLHGSWGEIPAHKMLKFHEDARNHTSHEFINLSSTSDKYHELVSECEGTFDSNIDEKLIQHIKMNYKDQIISQINKLLSNKKKKV